MPTTQRNFVSLCYGLMYRTSLACTTNELRQCASQPERVRQPSRIAALPKSGFEISLAKEELANQCLARWHVGVVLNPGAADGLESTVKNLLFDAIK